ncbi:DUF4173 domain-containing protein [Solwaraspora sp. WMMD1047]|uniref:DUF4153 domain-containing protein n=1 Tax=Solwaraspora sp. WMMD1047 TaxID=3016102 RepID=UPI00241809FD|nr:DUF4153 domain-containing protein [Solwaraspora sp. WMMD1047]MDG4827745.1 DUF4173 domain-containing protein [Solwaraspora sp. WMMD1047]
MTGTPTPDPAAAPKQLPPQPVPPQPVPQEQAMPAQPTPQETAVPEQALREQAPPEQAPPKQAPSTQPPPKQAPSKPATAGPAPLKPAAAPVAPSAIRRRWPGPAGPARPVVVGVALAAAAVSAVSIPLDQVGVGWLVGVLAGTVLVAVAGWPGLVLGATGAPRVTRLLDARLFWVLATVALVGVGAVRAAGWLFVLCLVTAGVTACLSVTGGRSALGMLLSLVIPPASVVRAVPWTLAGLGARPHPAGQTRPTPTTTGQSGTTPTAAGSDPASTGQPGRPGRSDKSGSGDRGGLGRVLASVAVSVVLLVVFGALFASADAAFADLLGAALPAVSVPTLVRWVFLFVVVGGWLLGAAYLLARPPDLGGLGGREPRRVRRWEWAVPLALLDALFALFVLVQITVLFGGAAHVLETSGLTYAEYARGGFWQLVVVSVLTLAVLAGAARWAPRADRTDRLLIRLLLGTLALLSLVIVGSALFRMNVYVEAYGATRLRLLVTACELWIGLVFGLVLVAGVRLRAGWLPRVAVGTAVLALLGLAVINPDRLIARTNIDRSDTSQLDLGYLSELSADAVPELDRLPAPDRNCVLTDIARRLDSDDWREANLGRAEARRIIAARPFTSVDPSCRFVRRS